MKKSTTILAVIFFTATILSSCGPSICDCYGSNDISTDTEECLELIEGMSTSEFAEELEKCD